MDTGLFEQVLRRHPRLVTVLAHAGMPEFDEALKLAASYETVFLDTTTGGDAVRGAAGGLADTAPACWA